MGTKIHLKNRVALRIFACLESFFFFQNVSHKTFFFRHNNFRWYSYVNRTRYDVVYFILNKTSCQVDVREDAAWLGAWCGHGRCLGSFLFFRAAVHSCRFLVADPLALPNFCFLFLLEGQHYCLVAISKKRKSLGLKFLTTTFLTAVAYGSAVPYWDRSCSSKGKSSAHHTSPPCVNTKF